MSEAFCKLIIGERIFWNSAFTFCSFGSCSDSLPLELPGALACKLKASFQMGRNLSVFPQDIFTDSSLKLLNRETTSCYNSKNICCIVRVTVSPGLVSSLTRILLDPKSA